MSIKVILVEDDKDMRKYIASSLGAAEGMELVASFAQAEELVESMAFLHPDVVLMDINLPGMSGIECVSKLKLLYPNVQFMMCTVLDKEDAIFDSLCAGATGYILKNSQSNDLINAVVELINGGSPMSSSIARKVVQAFSKNNKPNIEVSNLSNREKEVLEYLAKGYRYKEIAATLFLSVETIRTHIRNIYDKLQVQSRTEAINKAFGKN